MPILIDKPARIQATGEPPKTICEFIGRVRSQTENVSIAHMQSPAGWSEPGQRPDFDEYTVVLNGILRIECEQETIDLKKRPGRDNQTGRMG